MSVNATQHQADSIATLVEEVTELPVHREPSDQVRRGTAIWLAKDYEGWYSTTRWCFVLEGTGLDAVALASSLNEKLRSQGNHEVFCEPINDWSFGVYPV